MMGLPLNGVTVILAIPAVSAVLLGLLPGFRAAARINMLATLPHLPRGAVAFRREARAEPLHSGRRSQHRLYRAEYFRRLHHQRLQRQLHRP